MGVCCPQRLTPQAFRVCFCFFIFSFFCCSFGLESFVRIGVIPLICRCMEGVLWGKGKGPQTPEPLRASLVHPALCRAPSGSPEPHAVQTDLAGIPSAGHPPPLLAQVAASLGSRVWK